MTVIYPGPESIDPRGAPGGVVLHVYGTDDARLIHTSRIVPGGPVEALARLDADVTAARLHPGENPCLVFFDGDTGERLLHWPREVAG